MERIQEAVVPFPKLPRELESSCTVLLPVFYSSAVSIFVTRSSMEKSEFLQ